jgi:hypothetical protein
MQMVQLVEALHYKVVGSIPVGVTASNRNGYQEYFLWGKGGWCVRLTTLPPFLCADCHEIWESQPPGTLKACPEIALPLF